MSFLPSSSLLVDHITRYARSSRFEYKITLKKVLLRSSDFGPLEPQKMDQKSLLRIDLN